MATTEKSRTVPVDVLSPEACARQKQWDGLLADLSATVRVVHKQMHEATDAHAAEKGWLWEVSRATALCEAVDVVAHVLIHHIQALALVDYEVYGALQRCMHALIEKAEQAAVALASQEREMWQQQAMTRGKGA